MTKKQSGQNAYKSFGVLSVDILTYHPLLSLQTRFIHHGVLLLLFLIPIQHGFGPQVGVTPQTVGTVELCLRLFQSAWSSSHNSPRALSPGRCIKRKELQMMVIFFIFIHTNISRYHKWIPKDQNRPMRGF